MTVSRREGMSLFAAALAGLTLPGSAAAAESVGMTLGKAEPFDPQMVAERARRLAAVAYAEPPMVPKSWRDLTYDQYREIWFDGRNALWRGLGRAAQLEFFPAGLYFPSPVMINAVEDGSARQVLFDLDVFDTTDRFPALPDEGMGFSGFRVLGEIVEKGTFQEYAVFQGASYFRAIGRDQIYGLSARGLALNTGAPEGEEFPSFREFWVEAPEPGAAEVIVHALMDSPSVTGAYSFRIAKGETTEMEVRAQLFPRVPLTGVGVAPGTSMFLFDQTNRHRFDDFRTSVHDSDGLMVLNGAGEQIWRPLANPERLGFSVFSDNNPRGFGLMQRARGMADFGDLTAHYEKRPSLWVEPMDEWGPGAVILVEIPADREIYDNIVAFWRPADALQPGQEHVFRYRLHWCADAPVEGIVARVQSTASGARVFEPGRIFAIDFGPHPALGDDPAMLEARVSASNGNISSTTVQANPATGGVRLDLTLVPGEARFSELRAELWRNGERVSEVWLYRWTGAS